MLTLLTSAALASSVRSCETVGVVERIDLATSTLHLTEASGTGDCLQFSSESSQRAIPIDNMNEVLRDQVNVGDTVKTSVGTAMGMTPDGGYWSTHFREYARRVPSSSEREWVPASCTNCTVSAASPDGHFVATEEGEVVSVHTALIVTPTPYTMGRFPAFSEDSRRVVFVDEQGISAVTLRSGTLHSSAIPGVLRAAWGAEQLYATTPEAVHVVEADTMKVSCTWKGQPTGPVVAVDGAAFVATKQGVFRVSRDCTASLEVERQVESLAFSRGVLWMSEPGFLHTWDVKQRSAGRSLRTQGTVASITFEPSTHELYAWVPNAGTWRWKDGSKRPKGHLDGRVLPTARYPFGSDERGVLSLSDPAQVIVPRATNEADKKQAPVEAGYRIGPRLESAR